MSAGPGEPQLKRSRVMSRRTRRSELAARVKSSASKRSLKKILPSNSAEDESKQNKEGASTSSKAHVKRTKENSQKPSPMQNKICVSRDMLPTCDGDKQTGKETNLPLSHERIVAGSNNFLHYLSSVTRTCSPPKSTTQLLKGPLIRSWSNLVPVSVLSPFIRRVTVLACHPSEPHLVAAGSKGGELVLYNLKNNSDVKFIDGIGAGGSVVALKFHPEKSRSVYTASISGKVKCQDFRGTEELILLDSLTWSNWFCSLDVLPEKKLLVAGDSLGWLYTVSDSGEHIFHKKKVHKSKVTHAEFCPKMTNILVTSSTDHSVKLWDLRMFSSDPRSLPLHTLLHNKGINSAYFSPSSSTLLTTDQHSEIRVYSSPFWDLEATIPHPHRQFQHLTPIKATWHPFYDAVVVGRYPDDNFCVSDNRSIDFFDAHSGDELYRLLSRNVPGIKSLNCFNCVGDTLVSGSGYTIVFWGNAEEVAPSYTQNINKFESQSETESQISVDCKKEKSRRMKSSKSKKTK